MDLSWVSPSPTRGAFSNLSDNCELKQSWTVMTTVISRVEVLPVPKKAKLLIPPKLNDVADLDVGTEKVRPVYSRKPYAAIFSNLWTGAISFSEPAITRSSEATQIRKLTTLSSNRFRCAR